MAEVFTPEVSERICQHMNADHADAVALYARAFALEDSRPIEAARMLAIDPLGMDLLVTLRDAHLPVRIPFDPPLKDAEDAHHTLIDMVKTARARLAKTP
ncbi:DUF2470 domain-containing protein [Gloeobacter kilaueensis]|uniref:Heme iron utilization protein n=1 Tax=Gloeobacter kilaueensis (strain ATCC BAA-2537 / CCAP 1431/1 / ULC 316 / JS1) TaxID=1183438 RepID=U5QJ99_GLOK1|nr:DUF2470 domain-containing protein [Gloeobacter kilaueensis]AGY59057.1 heme iron utilization protein [Gloeobacter kilaueensis JS1]